MKRAGSAEQFLSQYNIFATSLQCSCQTRKEAIVFYPWVPTVEQKVRSRAKGEQCLLHFTTDKYIKVGLIHFSLLTQNNSLLEYCSARVRLWPLRGANKERTHAALQGRIIGRHSSSRLKSGMLGEERIFNNMPSFWRQFKNKLNVYYA